ncbi:MAG: hypothetical protein QGH15_02790 [Kiritimatiellia bacterium]|jgi:hypothetical protein|nr:hypothetical protein [Kiritimatiellia bacterium]
MSRNALRLCLGLLVLCNILTIDQLAAAEPAATGPGRTFSKTFLDISELEKATKFGEAATMCRQAMKTFTEPAQKKLLADAMLRLTRGEKTSIELTAAIKSLAAESKPTLASAREKLKNAGEVGRIHLRNAVRSQSGAIQVEAGSMLIILGDKYVPALFVDALIATHNPEIAELIGKTRAGLEADMIMKLAASAATYFTEVVVFLDALEKTATTAPIGAAHNADKPPVMNPARLPAHFTTAQRMIIVKTLAGFLEKYAKENAKPEEKAAAVRAETLLRDGRFPEAPGVVSETLSRHRTVPLSQRLIAVLQGMIDHVDTPALARLIGIAGSHGSIDSPTALLVIDILESRVTMKPQSGSPKKKPPDWKLLSSRVDKSLWLPLLTMLEAYVEKLAAPQPGGKALTEEQKAGLARAGAILTESTFPDTPGLLISRLKSNPSGPISEQLLALLKPMPGRLDQATIKLLIDCTASAKDDKSATIDFLMDVLETTAGAAAQKKGTPAAGLDKLPARLNMALHSSAIGALMGHIDKQWAKMKTDTSTLSPEEKATMERAEHLLVESRFPAVPALLVAKLATVKEPAPSARLVSMLSKMTDRLDGNTLKALAPHAVNEGPNRAAATTLILDAIQRIVSSPTPVTKSTKPSASASEKLAARLPPDVQLEVAKALVACMRIPKPTDKDKALIAQAEKVIVTSGLPQLTTLLISELSGDQSAPSAERCARLFLKMPATLPHLDVTAQSTVLRLLIAAVEKSDTDKTTLASVEKLLAAGGMVRTQPELVAKLASLKPGPVAVRLSGILVKVTQLMDSETIKTLSSHVAQGTEMQPLMANALVDAVEDIAAAPTVITTAAQRNTIVLGSLTVRLNQEAGTAAAAALAAFLNKQATQYKPPAQNPSHTERALVVRAQRILLQGRLPTVPKLLAGQVSEDPASPVAYQAVKLLAQATDRLAELDATSQASLVGQLITFIEKRSKATLSSTEKASLADAGKILNGCGACQVQAPIIQKLTSIKPGPFTDQLVLLTRGIPRLDPPMLTLLADHVLKGGENHAVASDLLFRSLDRIAAAPTVLPQHGSATAADLARLPARLEADQPPLIASTMVATLERTDKANPSAEEKKNNAKAVRILTGCRLPQTPALLADQLKKDPARPFADKAAALMSKMPDRMTELDSNAQKALVESLITFMEKRISAQMTTEQKASIRHAETILTQARLHETTQLLTAKLESNPNPQLANNLASLLKKLSIRIDKSTLNRISALAKKEGPNKALVTTLETYLVQQLKKN